MMVVWLAVVDEAGPITGWGRADFISYYVAAAMVYEATASWTLWDWDDDIRTGKLSVKLLKPLDPIHSILSSQFGWKFIILLIVVPVVAVLAWLSPAIQYTRNPAMLAAFGLSVIAGFAVNFTMSSAFAMIAFWSTQSSNVYSFWYGVGQFLSGWIAPLALFPPAIRLIAYWLPFRSTLGFPIEILMGQLHWPAIWSGFAISLAWIMVFLVVYRFLWRRGLRRYEAVGA